MTATAMETPLTKGERTRQVLLDAAVVRFGRDGFRGASLAEIARDARMSGTAAYAYFPSKEALFFAAVDQDAAAVLREGLSSLDDHTKVDDWRTTVIFTLLAAVERHPLARRILAGLEPDVTARVLTIPALEDLRRAFADRIRQQQRKRTVRIDVDADSIANGLVTIVMSLLMSLVQIGANAATLLGADVAAVLAAALSPPRRTPKPR
jgi:AcrR family transcriptional regulator